MIYKIVHNIIMLNVLYSNTTLTTIVTFTPPLSPSAISRQKNNQLHIVWYNIELIEVLTKVIDQGFAELLDGTLAFCAIVFAHWA